MILKWVVAVQIVVVVGLSVNYFLHLRSTPTATVSTTQGEDINRRAWEASFTERGLSVPPQGPREGYWGDRLEHPTYDEVLGWRPTEQYIPGLLHINEHGWQQLLTGDPDALRLMILGASVAYGAYSSTEATTYFAQLQSILGERGIPVDITVIAAGAWKSEQSLQALMKNFDSIKPDAILFVNGLNSLTVGATAYARYSERTETSDGSEWSLMYHERDYDDRVKVYTRNMARAKDFARTKNIPIFYALQPALFEKKPHTAIEEEIVRLYERMLGPRDMLIESYSRMRSAMNALVGSGAYFLDLSRAFNGETATTFADMWHFSNPGHRIVAERLADFLGETLKLQRSKKAS